MDFNSPEVVVVAVFVVILESCFTAANGRKSVNSQTETENCILL